jgi:signal transduction histidine kinase
MNFLGKIFIVLLFIMSVLFMGAAVSVYGTHRDLKAKVSQAQSALTQANSQLEIEKADYNRRMSELTALRDAAAQQARKLETERVALVDGNTRIQQELDQLRQASREAVAAVSATEANNETLATEVQGLRGEIRTNQLARDKAFAVSLEKTEAAQQMLGELESATERNKDLVQDNSRMTSVLRENGLNPATPVEDIKPKVDGMVIATQRRNGMLLVAVSIGSDDGLKPGHTVEVFNNSKYLGRVEILKTSPDKAVGRVDVNYQQGPIQEGDRVATRLKLS